MNRFQRFFLEFNLFKTSKTDQRSLRVQRWSTRLYIPVLFIAMSILLVYTITNVQSKQIQIQNPSLTTYTNLYNKYGNVRCPCTEIFMPYEKFLELIPEFHQVCSSDLISDQWIYFLYDKETTTIRYPPDFRATAFNQFQILQQLCQLSIASISDGIVTLYKSDLITGELLNENLFSAQVEADVLTSQTITTSDFTRSLMFMRSFTTGNELLTAIQTAYTLIIDGDTSDIDLHNLSTLLV